MENDSAVTVIPACFDLMALQAWAFIHRVNMFRRP
jgi:hypothetical protein